MSNVPIQDAASTTRKIDTFQRTEGADTVETQAVALVDPATGNALVPTGAGRMPVDGTFWQTTQPVSFTWAGLTDAQLRATALPVSGTFWQATQPVSFTWAGLTDTQLRAAPIQTQEATTGTHFQPGFDLSAGPGAGGPLRTDPDGNLVARAQVLTDELGYRCNFANTSLAVSIGTATFTNGSTAVTGAGFVASDLRADDYVKLNADVEAAWMQVSSVDSDVALTLVSAYTGAGGAGASSRSIMKPSTGSGGSISVASGVCTITSGTTTGAITEIERDVDWLPLVKQTGVTINQRIANQGTYIGYYDESTPAAPKWFAWIVADGVTNTTVKCQSARNPTQAPSAAETEETVVTLPNGATTATARRFRTEVLGDRVAFYCDSILLATHYRAMPGPGDLLTSTVRIVNGTAPASSTTVTVDYDTVKNHNKLEVGLMSDSEQVVANQAPVQTFTYTAGAVVIPINTDLMVIDCSQLRHLSVHLAAIGTTGVVTPAWSGDGVNWLTATMLNEAGAASTTVAAPGAALRTTNVRARYFRLRMTTATTAAGSNSIVVAGFQQDMTAPITTQPVSGSVTVSGTVTATVTGGTTLPVTPTTTFTNSAATTNANFSKASAGTVWSVFASNINAAVRYLKLYNKASAPTVGTDVPVIVVPIPAGGFVQVDPGSNGIRFATGIAWAITGLAADSDTTVVGVNEHKIAITFT